uniref:RING-type E3 ubiquitin transferase n=1 Tax=Acanthochromis polyacanthus TaxID=80966 RepID=A0A3Q1FFN4_9TELE
MGGKQSTAGRPRGAFPGVSTDDSAVPPSAHFGHYRPSGTMGLIQVFMIYSLNYELLLVFVAQSQTWITDFMVDQDHHLHRCMFRLQFSSTWSEHVGLFFSAGFKCPVCSKSVASNEMEVHFIMCLSKPRLSYNDDVLARDAGECVICLEELQQGDTIARLPCLCIYHKR